MKDPMDMTDEEFRLYQARQRAAGVYRSEGFQKFAWRVEAGLEDTCSQVRLAQFFIDPSPPPTKEYIAAWEEIANDAGQGDEMPDMFTRAGVAAE